MVKGTKVEPNKAVQKKPAQKKPVQRKATAKTIQQGEQVGVCKKKPVKKSRKKWWISLAVVGSFLVVGLYDTGVIPDVFGMYEGLPKEDRDNAKEDLEKVDKVLAEVDPLGKLDKPLQAGYTVMLTENRSKGKVLVIVTVGKKDWEKYNADDLHMGLISVFRLADETVSGMRLDKWGIEGLTVKVRITNTWTDLARVTKGFMGGVKVEML